MKQFRTCNCLKYINLWHHSRFVKILSSLITTKILSLKWRITLKITILPFYGEALAIDETTVCFHAFY